MGITRISSLHDCGVFRDFTWPSELSEFGRYNLIYGWNWTGKTTLSRVFRDLELRRVPTMGQVTLSIDGGHVRGEEFPNSTLHVRVFNRDFVEESVFRRDGQDVPPIFVVGRESVEKQKEAERVRADHSAKETELQKARDRKKEAEGALDRHCIDRAKLIKDTLRASGSNYNDYDKGDYRRAVEDMATDVDPARHRLSEMERDRLLAVHKEKWKPKQTEVSYGLPRPEAMAREAAELLGRVVVSAAIDTLTDDGVLAEWVRHGLELHKGSESDVCLFCEQRLPEERLAQLEAHFNAEYERLLRDIDAQIRSLESTKREAVDLELPDRARLYDDLAEHYDTAEREFRRAVDTLQAFSSDLIEALDAKKAAPFGASSLTVSVPDIDDAVAERLNEIIRRHNAACDDFDQCVREARDRLALDVIVESLDEFVRLRDAAQTATVAIEPLQDQIARLSGEINELERDIIGHRRSGGELNEDLKRYLGHSEIQLTARETGYAITRNGVQVTTLSEGETTAIALLYFLKSLEDRSYDKTDGVVVLDDPVSSLDANALYLAFGFIRKRTEDARQLFILTHNFSFFRQVRNWFHHLKGQKKSDIRKRPARFLMLDCTHRRSGRCATIRRLDPLLEQYDSEYHYLFARVYRASTDAGPTKLEQHYALPNIARRLLEAFLAFRQPRASQALWQKVQAVPFDEAKKLRILRFLHTYSHSTAVGEPEHDPSVLAEGAAVLKDLLELIQSQDADHYSAMEQLVATHEERGEDEVDVVTA